MWIDICKLPVNLKLGFYAEERQHLQTAYVTLRIHVSDDSGAGTRDELAGTVDYGAVIQSVDTCLADREFKLVEAVVERIGNVIMDSQPLCEQVDVKVVKTVLPRNCARGAEVSVSKAFGR